MKMANLKYFVSLTVPCLLAAVLATEGARTQNKYKKWIEHTGKLNKSHCERMKSVKRVDETHAPFTEIKYKCRHLRPKILFLIECDGICQDPKTKQPLVGYKHVEEKKKICVSNPRKCKVKYCFKITISCQCVLNT